MTPSLLLLLLSLLLLQPAAAYSVSLPATFLEDVGGSGEAEEGPSATSPGLPPPPGTPALGPTLGGRRPPQPTAAQEEEGGAAPPTSFLEGIEDFFRQYVLLIAVVGSLAFLLMFIVCAALITRQKHKATAYYPSSFPKKNYVDQRDRAGGPRVFSELPDRAPDSRADETPDSPQQLQADILAATQNLRSPARVAPGHGGGEGARLAEGGSEAQGPSGHDVAQGLPARAGLADKPTVPVESCTVEAQGGPAAGESPEGPPGSSSLAQEPAASPEGPCACSRVPPSV
uniref:transmembrane protein 119 n=1 Tax=Jaculus jaculus TaxID=51337 RepID=UPI001E1B05C6|nr:transmembrane protein 119 [Jaculus jaculus]